ncbi:MAG: HDOD domain-containing protein [Roseateles asaccharophilus]|uniref:HD-like signal output (HDOD) protein n=1 Tax=Roseateles asaccharophilus TaxID=582607 RepID=A0A4V3CJ06_9BURK|nr:HDOD domain-containing protein [Roseateles asaccharophilus]MDN3545757.1 HDOD domain-containing protein [Roseateles asaccharophilus]TDP07625.1 HD-like signal output (HDOD) protein [Roseateles asaccharophilus]
MSALAEQFFTKNHKALPTMPEVASRLLKSFDDENISLAAIAELVGKDSTLAAKVLRLANSAHYSPSHNVATLEDAAHALGMDKLRNLSLAACISGAFPLVSGLDRALFWRHGIMTAGYARVLSRVLQLDADTAYLAGLMLRTGQLLMAMSEPALVADVEAHAAEPGSRFSLEMYRFGCTHADVTAVLAQRWHFPDKMVEAFKDANTPLEIKPFSLMAAVLHLAEVLADAAEHHDDPVQAMQVAVPELLAHLHLDLDFLRSKIEAAGDLGADVDSLLH